MNHPEFTMSMYASKEELYKAKSKYFEGLYKTLEENIIKEKSMSMNITQLKIDLKEVLRKHECTIGVGFETGGPQFIAEDNEGKDIILADKTSFLGESDL